MTTDPVSHQRYAARPAGSDDHHRGLAHDLEMLGKAAIARRRAQEVQGFRGIKLSELPSGNLRNRAEPPAISALEQRLRVSATKAADHSS